MTSPRSLTPVARVAAAALALVAGSAGALAAQGRPLFAWSGRVDREVTLVMRGSGVDTRASSRDDYGRVRVGSALPRRDGVVQLRVDQGRGSVQVLEQPSARNGYTAVVRLRDDQSGAGDYRVAAYWQPVNGTYAGDYGTDDRGRDRSGNNGRGGGWGRGGQNGSGPWDRTRDRDRDRDDNGDWDRGDRDTRGDRDGGVYDDRRSGGNSPWDRILGRGGNSGGSGVLRWSGRVDDVQEIRIRGRRTDTYAVSGRGAAGVRSSVSGGLPARDVYVRVRQYDGRGRVRVVEQPSARNDYTAVLRVEDREGGAGFYDFEATW